MPRSAAALPRQMLPPPMTRPTCTPRSLATCRTSAATRSRTAEEMIPPCSSTSASPLILRRTRRYLSFFGGTSDLGAQLEAGEAPDPDVLAVARTPLGDQILHRLALVADVALQQQHLLRLLLVGELG